MKITIKSDEPCRFTPRWNTLQAALTDAFGVPTVLTRISREDKSCNYRSTGRYALTAIVDNRREVKLTLTVE